MKKLLNILLIIPVLYILIIPVYIVKITNSKPCEGIVIDIKDSSDYHFVTRKTAVEPRVWKFRKYSW